MQSHDREQVDLLEIKMDRAEKHKFEDFKSKTALFKYLDTKN